MCGITGIFAFNLVGKFNMINLAAATQSLEKRGPDNQNIYSDSWIGLGHRRLSIIDTSAAGNQPMWDESGRYAIIYNGEIFNFQELRKELEAKGISFASNSDTEVLLKIYIDQKEKCLNRLNGFFAFCIYDKQEQTFFIARDRYGVKPLLYLVDDDKFLFGSEMKAMMAYGINKDIDFTSVCTYLQLNYIPAPRTIFKQVKKLLPGHFAKVSHGELELKQYYAIPYDRELAEKNKLPYEHAKKRLYELMEESVQKRLVADVSLGCFLSGGIDSTVITALASRHKRDMHTFSIGFKDEKFFDETEYATLAAKHLKTGHTVFSLSNADLYKHVHTILDSIDEPFADSSAINVYILSKETRKYATVALSGDGADEMLGGYNKHAAFYRNTHPGIKEQAVTSLLPLWKALPKSRSSSFANRIRQFQRFAEGAKLASQDRYWKWAGFASESEVLSLLSESSQQQYAVQEYRTYKENLLTSIPTHETVNDVLHTDTQLVLPNDMLTKVDLMSMANGLEVRTPFLDYEVVNFLFSLPENYKINADLRKRVLQDAFRDMLPTQLYNRPKKGFEVPLLKWFKGEMKSLITDDLLSEKFIKEQNIFNYAEIEKLKQKLFSSNPEDIHARIWALIVFQWWWRKYCST
jgi:asparagine synthase (glutamine-hydrolysing)